MEDILNILAAGTRPQYFGKWKTTSTFLQTEDDLNVLANVRRPIFLENGRRPQYFGKWKTTSILWQMENDINFLRLEDDLKFECRGDNPNFLIGNPGLANPSLS
jgi:hypothetical protein